jgi:cell division protein FtsI/penicillin-binding protein 2
LGIHSESTVFRGDSRSSAAPDRSGVVSSVTAGGLTLLLAVLLARVVQLQIAPGEQLQEQMSDRVTSIRDLASRGDFLYRQGQPAAVTRFGYRVVVDPTILKREALDASIVQLSRAINVDAELIGREILTTISSNDAILAMYPPPVKEASGLRGLLLGNSKSANGAGEVSPDLDNQFLDTLPQKPARFVVLGEILTDEQVAKVRALKIAGVSLEQREIREYPSGTIAGSIVGLAGAEPQWGVGAERRLSSELEGSDGSVSYTRDAAGKPLWMERGQVKPAQPGHDIRLSIDIELQRLAYQELMRGVEDADAAGGRCIVLDPLTGEVLAMVDIVRDLPGLTPFAWPDNPKATPEEKAAAAAHDAKMAAWKAKESKRLLSLGMKPQEFRGHPRYIVMADDPGRAVSPAMARNRCIEDVYEPGSTFKAFVWSVITELGVMKPGEIVNTEGGTWRTSFGRYIEDVREARTMTWAEVLVHSSNIGMIKGSLKLTSQQMRDICVRFGFGKKTGIELPGEASGIVTPLKAWSVLTQSSVAHGYEIAVTPIQMARAFCAFARPGELSGTLPQVQLRAVVPAGGNRASLQDFQRGVIYRVIPSDVANFTRDVMSRVAEAAESKMKDTPVGGWRYTMFGKSGTAEITLSSPPKGKMKPKGKGYFDDQYNSSFIAAGPTEAPRLVVLVVIDDPGPRRIAARQHYGSWVAAPVVRRVMERSLTYLGTPPSAPPQKKMANAE